MLARGCLEYNGKAIPRPEAIKELATSDYLLLLDLNEKNTDLQVPAKLFDYVRIGRPILAFTAEGSPVARILARCGVRQICVAPGWAEERVDDLVAAFFSLPTESIAPSPWFQEEFNVIQHTRTLAARLDSLGARGLAGHDPSS